MQLLEWKLETTDAVSFSSGHETISMILLQSCAVKLRSRAKSGARQQHKTSFRPAVIAHTHVLYTRTRRITDRTGVNSKGTSRSCVVRTPLVSGCRPVALNGDPCIGPFIFFVDDTAMM